MNRLAAIVTAVAVAAALALLLLPRGGGAGAVRPPPAGETLDQQVRRVADAVAALRELDFQRLPEPTFVDPATLRAQVRRDAGMTANEAAIEVRILHALGLAEPDLDLRERVLEALTDQVVGMYHAPTDELVVATADPGRPLDAVSEITLAHELDHALTDQRLPRPPSGGVSRDAQLAAQAVLEGDATLLSLRYLDALVVGGDRRPARPPEASRALDEVPLLVRDLITFPYTWGRVFAEQIIDDDGWAALDRAYRDPPTTSLEILYPDRWRDDFAPLEVSDAPPSPPGWRRLEDRSFGAAELLSLYSAPADDPARRLDSAYARVGAWRGGKVTVYADGSRTALAVRLRGEAQLCADLERWYGRSFPPAEAAVDDRPGLRWAGDGRAVHIRCPGDEVRLGLADSADVARALTR